MVTVMPHAWVTRYGVQQPIHHAATETAAVLALQSSEFQAELAVVRTMNTTKLLSSGPDLMLGMHCYCSR
jgi:hypothetical protein